MIRNFKQIEMQKDYVDFSIAYHHDNFIVLRVIQRFESLLKTQFNQAIKIGDKNFSNDVIMKLHLFNLSEVTRLY